MQTTFGAYLVGLLAVGSELAAALPQMNIVEPRAVAGQRISVPVKHNTARSKTIKHPALVYAKALNKYNVTLPSHVQKVVDRFRLPVASTKRGSGQGSVANSPEDSDSEYISTISVGTPAVSLPMDFDTGSSDLWVMGPKISGASKTYDPSSSSSATEMTGSSWQISYGDGSSSSGDVYKDKVTIGNLTVSAQAVEVATTVSEEFTEDSAMSGLVGLAMSSLNTISPTPQNTWFDNIKSSLESPVFTANLNHEKDGTYNFGYVDESAYTGTMYYADLITGSEYGGYWTIAASGYAVGDGSSSTSSSSGSSSSGTSSSSSGTGTSSSSGSSSTGGYGGYGGYGGGDETGTGTGSYGGSSGTGTSSSSGSSTTSSGYGGGGFGGDGYGGGESGSSGYGGYGETSSDSSSGDDWLSSIISGLEGGSDSSSSSDSTGSDFLSSGFGFKKERKTTMRPTRTTTPKRSVTLTDTAITGIADTGTTLLMLPDAVVSAYYAQVDGAEESQEEGGYVFSCSATLPDFVLGIGEGQITVPGDYINYMAIDSSGEQCYGGIQSDADIGMAIFGDVALKSAFVVFDSANSRVGWAAKTLSS